VVSDLDGPARVMTGYHCEDPRRWIASRQIG